VVVELSLEEVATGVRRTIEVRRQVPCDACSGSGAKAGSKPARCATCGGHGQVEAVQGFFSLRTTCPRCHGQGVTIEDPCTSCRGEGRRAGKREVVAEVPAGVHEGNQLRLRGEGDAGTRGGPAGDLFCFIKERRHDLFVREGDDVYCEVPVSFADAALGCELEVPTLRGKAAVTVTPGTQSGDILRLRGQGLPSLEGGQKGSLLVRVAVETPRRLTARMRELFGELQKAESEASQPARSGFFERLQKFFKGRGESA
jgi:molecular chaperone DnaJ